MEEIKLRKDEIRTTDRLELSRLFAVDVLFDHMNAGYIIRIHNPREITQIREFLTTARNKTPIG